jgi:hypothetical protein
MAASLAAVSCSILNIAFLSLSLGWAACFAALHKSYFRAFHGDVKAFGLFFIALQHPCGGAAKSST